MNSTDYTTCGNGVRDAGEDCDDMLDDGVHGCVSGCASGVLPDFECTGGSSSSVDDCYHYFLIDPMTASVTIVVNAYTLFDTQNPTYTLLNSNLVSSWLIDAGGTGYNRSFTITISNVPFGANNYYNYTG